SVSSKQGFYLKYKQKCLLFTLQTGSFLKHKLCSRPERSELVRLHILQETQAEPSLQATQMKLKRARLADNLNEKITQRPGPLELVEKNILPVDSAAEEGPNDVYSFNEDSSEALSPQQPVHPPFASSDAGENDATCASSKISPSTQQSLSRLPTDKSRSKRNKEPKPRVKKLKYHQYIPPDRKQEPSEVQMDSAYARLLQQQQQFLQLQILSQQQFNFQATVPALFWLELLPPPMCSPSRARSTASACKVSMRALRGAEQAFRDDLLCYSQVAELKMELKLRSLPVSGTKTDLIERLRLYQETSNLQTAAASVEKTVIAEAPQPENVKLSPPVSPIASRVSSLGIEDRGAVDGPAQLAVTAVSAHSVGSAVEESPTDKRSPEKDSEKDKRLHEKERQIKELMRKLEQEQRLVEELKMQLEVEKRSQHSDSPPHFSPLQVKEENMSPSSCSGACSSPGLIKQEHVEDPVTQVLQSHFVMGQQTAKPPEPEQPAEAGAHILLAAPFPATTIAIQLPTSSIILHSPDNSAALGLLPPAAQMPPNAEASQQQFSSFQPASFRAATEIPKSRVEEQRPALLRGCGQTDTEPAVSCSGNNSYLFVESVAVTDSQIFAGSLQGPTAASQHMDDLFDVLIESGGEGESAVQVAQLPAASLRARPGLADLSSPSLLGRTLACSDSPAVTMEMDFNDSTLPSSLNLNGAGMDNMDWLDLNLSAEGVSSLDISAPAGVFSDFLDSHDLQLNWD
uniref:Myocardin related transcription factor Bb n=1 Tax=Takifugu rubripes TaxID=31033 RepID=H2TZH8_TAKRU